MSISSVNGSLTSVLNTLYGTAGTSGSSQSSAEETSLSEDSVTLSPQALQLSALFGTEAGQSISMGNLATFATKKLDEFEKQFKSLMEANGVDTSQPITLGHEYGTGRVVVTNDHPDADKIEQLLAQNRDLCNTYTAATSTLSIVKQAQEHGRFAEAYEKNPLAAVAQFSYLFNNSSRWGAKVTFQEDGYEVSYNQTIGGSLSLD